MDPIVIGNDQVRVAVSPLGAEMQWLTTSDGSNWLWHGDAAYWSGRSPVLFPIVGKAPDGQLRIDGKLYPMGQHGFARRSRFTLVGGGSDSCRFELDSDETSRAIYPYDFLLAIEHRVVGRGVTVTAEVTNRDHRPMPFGLGFHPAFKWPLPGCAGLEHSVTLHNGAEPPLIRLAEGLVREEPLPSPFQHGVLRLDHGLFEADAMLFPDGAGAGATYAAGQRAIRFTWENLPNFAIWSKPGAPFVCLEPWHGTAAVAGGSDELADRPYTEVLGPGATGRYGFRAELVG